MKYFMRELTLSFMHQQSDIELGNVLTVIVKKKISSKKQGQTFANFC